MISDTSALWIGKYPELYADEIKAHFECGDERPLHLIDCSKDKPDSDEAKKQLVEMSTLFAQNNMFVIRNADEWKAADLATTLKKIADHRTEYDLCVTWNKGKTVKALDVIPNSFDYSVGDPFDWALDFAEANSVSVSEDTVESLVDFCGDNEEMLVSSFRSSVLDTQEDEEVEWSVIRTHLSTLGGVESIEVLKAVQAGDARLTAETVNRVLLSEDAEKGSGFRITAMLMTVFRSASICSGLSFDDAQEIGAVKNKWSYNKNRDFAKSLGQQRLNKGIEIIAEMTRAIRGGSKMQASSLVAFEAMRLANVCNTSKKGNRRTER